MSQTTVAQLVCFCLASFKSEPVLKRARVGWRARELSRWPTPYEEATDADSSHVGSSSQDSGGDPPYKGKISMPPASSRVISLRSRATCKDHETAEHGDEDEDEDDHDSPARTARTPKEPGANKRKGPPSNNSAGDTPADKRRTPATSEPTSQYCTQACLLGLKRGWDHDDNCPNVSVHRGIEGGSRHTVNVSKFTTLVSEQVQRSPYEHCVAVDPYGVEGKIGAIGALLKLELTPYGYTLVAKSTQAVHLGCLRHECPVHSRLKRLQGQVVPVYLGIVEVAKGRYHALPGTSRIVYMMLMSWGGETVEDVGYDRLVEVGRLP